ncbi:MAG: 3-oxoacyl-ACP synthase [Rhodococcus sp.]|nr:3-oxoacyl-ACP synthase [Rhodococcus sp. (in: high G+C Gram-positive bacteria)]
MNDAAPVTLESIVFYAPEREVSARDLAELEVLPIARREHARALGIDTVRVAAELDHEVDLAHAAAAQLLQESGIDASELDALVMVQGRAPHYLLASEATRLQHRLGAHRAFTTTVGDLGCVSVSAALTMAAALLRGEPRFRFVLVVAAAKSPTRARYRPPMTLLGDGAAAVLLTTSGRGRYELVDQIVRSDGRYADLFRIDYRTAHEQEWVEECADEPTYSFKLAVDSRSRFTRLNSELLERNGIGSVDTVLMQNLSVGAFAFWEEALDLEIDPVCRRALAAYGHLGSVDILLDLEYAAATQDPGALCLVLNSSPVAAWSSALLRRVPDLDTQDR